MTPGSGAHTKSSSRDLSHAGHAQVNEFVKRVRAARIHILIMGHLRKQMPVVMGKSKAQEKMLANLNREFAAVQREHHLPAGMALLHRTLQYIDVLVFSKYL